MKRVMFTAVFTTNRVAVKIVNPMDPTGRVAKAIARLDKIVITTFTKMSEAGTLLPTAPAGLCLDRWTDCRYKPFFGKQEPECVFARD